MDQQMIVSAAIAALCFGGVGYIAWWGHQREKLYTPWSVYWTDERKAWLGICSLLAFLLVAMLIGVDLLSEHPARPA